MDFGMAGLDGLVVGGSEDTTTTGNCFPDSLPPSSDPSETKQKPYGSGFLKQQRPAGTVDDYWRSSSKVAKTTAEDYFSASKAMLQQQQRGPLFRSNSTTTLSDGQQMLSFSSPNSHTATTPSYYHSTYNRNTGYGGLSSAAGMHGVLTGLRGSFTPSQWMELEHQALIYKYINANVPVPSNLLIPIRKALDFAGFSGFSGGRLMPSALGWGAFHIGFSNTTDPEPGRCRRTDGKKWRCSRDAVADQKYCERHMNRGRHRSRKPVEGQSGHSASGPTTSTKLMPTASSVLASVVPGGVTSDSLSLSNHPQLNSLQPGAPNLCASSPHINRNSLNKENMGERIQHATDLSMFSTPTGLKDDQFSFPKQQNNCEESYRAEFGRVCSDSLLNPLHESSSLVHCRNYGSSQDLNKKETESPHAVRQFMDDWPKNQRNRTTISWPQTDMQADSTQLSISIPMAASDFMSSTSSRANKKLALSPLRLSRELDTTQMGLGVGSIVNEPNRRQEEGSCNPISWETSMGGPLGEVLHSTSSSGGDCKNSSALNLMTEGWDSSLRLASSPTGVLQKMTFASLSNSSAGSSPRAENPKTHEGASHFCNDLLGSTLL